MLEANCWPVEEGNEHTDWRHHHTDWSTDTIHCEHCYENFTTAYSDGTDPCHTYITKLQPTRSISWTFQSIKTAYLSMPDECIQCARVNVTLTTLGQGQSSNKRHQNSGGSFFTKLHTKYQNIIITVDKHKPCHIFESCFPRKQTYVIKTHYTHDITKKIPSF